jgi:anti-anti-sigma factor
VQRHFRVDFVEQGTSAVLALSGELDVASSPMLEAELIRAADREFVIVDLRELEFIDSTGLGTLVRAYQQAQEAGRRFALVRGPARCSGCSALPAFRTSCRWRRPAKSY